MKNKDKCLRCGKCCYYPSKHKKWLPCPYLSLHKGGFTRCLIYNRRIGRIVAPGIICTFRRRAPYDIPGCPYNTDKPPHPYFK